MDVAYIKQLESVYNQSFATKSSIMTSKSFKERWICFFINYLKDNRFIGD